MSFSEILLVLILGLVVLGPQRLPIAIKTVASWIKVLRRMSASVQLEINKEFKLQEIQDSLNKVEKDVLGAMTPELESSIAELKKVASSLQEEIKSTINIDKNDDSLKKN